MCSINGTFLEYQYLLNKIPQSWITQINDNHVHIFENKINVTCNVFVKKFMKAKKGRRVFYDTFANVNEPVHEIFNNLVCATSKASDQSVHTRSLIRAFASSWSIL